VIRHLALAALALVLAAPAAPASAQDDLARQLIDTCMGCRLPKDMHGRDLHGLRFTGTDLRDVDFSHANLSGAKFTGADLDGTRFDDADLRNVQFVGVRLRRTSFARANTAGVRFLGASVTQADIDGVAGRLILHDCTGCSLNGLDLHDADLRGSRVIGASLNDAKLTGARLNDARLAGASARDADLSHTDLRGADLVATDLRNARLGGATIGDAILCSENRYDDQGDRRVACTNLRGVVLHGLDFRAARFCTSDGRDTRSCRAVTRRELTDSAHADLTGAQAPA
jgi:uncharacterized protein YjbI with pentapeptide repeats